MGERQKVVLITLFSIDNKNADQAGTSLLLEENGEWRTNNIDPQLLVFFEGGCNEFPGATKIFFL
jgi:hypothetical protein